jgi:hypothetical protein
MGPTGFLEMSVINYISAVHEVPEERRSHLSRGGSLDSRSIEVVHVHLRLTEKGILKYLVKRGGA